MLNLFECMLCILSVFLNEKNHEQPNDKCIIAQRLRRARFLFGGAQWMLLRLQMHTSQMAPNHFKYPRKDEQYLRNSKN